MIDLSNTYAVVDISKSSGIVYIVDISEEYGGPPFRDNLLQVYNEVREKCHANMVHCRIGFDDYVMYCTYNDVVLDNTGAYDECLRYR